MSGGWKGSNRDETLPADWPALRDAQLQRDGWRCVWIMASGNRCGNAATDVDHYGKPWEHDKLRSLCSGHHDRRSSQQGVQAKAALRRLPSRRAADRRPSDGWA